LDLQSILCFVLHRFAPVEVLWKKTEESKDVS